MATLEQENNQEHDLYVRALRCLGDAGKTSEHLAPATTKREIDFMHETQRVVSKRVFQSIYKDGQFEQIFAKEET